METYKSSSNLKPETWQKEIDFVYHNFNVTEEEKETEEGKEIIYVYDVEKYTLNEYVDIVLAEQKTSIKDLEDAVCELGEIIGG